VAGRAEGNATVLVFNFIPFLSEQDKEHRPRNIPGFGSFLCRCKAPGEVVNERGVETT
jgi:hypothetical protein